MRIIQHAWYSVIALTTLGLLALVGPKVYNQIEFQFFSIEGDPSMWPATFEGILILISILSAALALIFCSKGITEKGNKFSRIAVGVLAFSFLIMWIYGAMLWQNSYPSFFPQSLWARMISNDASLILLLGIVLHLIYALSGRGIAVWVFRSYKRITRNSEQVDTGIHD